MEKPPGEPRKAKSVTDPKQMTHAAIIEAAASHVVYGEPLTIRGEKELGIVLPSTVKVYRNLNGLSGISRVLRLSFARAEHAYEVLGFKVNDDGDVEYTGPTVDTDSQEYAIAVVTANEAAKKVIPAVKLVISDRGNSNAKTQNQKARALLDSFRARQRGILGPGEGNNDPGKDDGTGGRGVQTLGGVDAEHARGCDIAADEGVC